jgi:probable HAF family extracellular repeat protein
MNEHGQVTGTLMWQNPADGSLGIDGWVHSGGALRMLPGLGGNSTRPHAINALGDVVGDSLTPPGDRQEQHAVLIAHDGTLTDLGTLGGPSATASGINIRGQVVGSSALSADPRAPRIAFFHNGTVMMPIHIEGATGTSAAAINDEGEVAGSYFTLDDKGLSVSRALYYANGKAVDLNTLVVDAAPGVYLIYAKIIYNDGRIVAFGGVEGDSTTRTYLLTPVEDGDPATLTRRWRRR